MMFLMADFFRSLTRVWQSGAIAAFLVMGVVQPALALDTVTFETGNAPEQVAKALRETSLILAAQRDGVSAPQDLVAAARADYGRLVAALYTQGRYSGTVNILIDGREAAAISPFQHLTAVRNVEVHIRPGPVFRFGEAQVRPVAWGSELPPGFTRGATAYSPLVGDAVSAVIDGWRNIGHAKASIERQSLHANHLSQILDVDVSVAPGPRLSFGKLLVEGQSNVHTSRIRTIAGLPEGAVFSPDDMEAAATRLRRTGAFRSVALSEAETVGPDNTLDITAAVVDEKPRRYGVGAEISTLEGLLLSGYWIHRNLLGGAERLRIDGEISGIGGETGGTDYSFGARYERPATIGPDTSVFATLEAERLNETDFQSDNLGFGVGAHRIFSDTLEGELAVELRNSHVTDTSGVMDFNLLSLPATLIWDRRDNALNPTSGFYLGGELRPFFGFGTTSSGLRIETDARTYRGFGEENRFVLAGRFQLGSIVGPTVIGSPPDYLFYSGGGGTVRGQSYQSLGVNLGGGIRRGGRSFLGLSSELRASFTETLGAVAFADAGYIGSGSFYDGNGDWHGGIGLGLRYNTGIGPIRFDVATPVGGTGNGLQIYVGIGQSF